MKQLVLAILALIILSFSNETMAAELYSDEALEYMADIDHQAVQQYIMCKEVYYHNNKNVVKCFKQSMEAYKLFVSWTIHNTGKNEMMDRCLERSLEHYWIPSKNTAPWNLVISQAWRCYENKLSY